MPEVTPFVPPVSAPPEGVSPVGVPCKARVTLSVIPGLLPVRVTVLVPPDAAVTKSVVVSFVMAAAMLVATVVLEVALGKAKLLPEVVPLLPATGLLLVTGAEPAENAIGAAALPAQMAVTVV